MLLRLPLLDLLLEALRDPATADLQCVMLGSGDPWLEHAIRALAQEFPQRIAAHFGYDTALSHQVFASADAFVMPSRFEPCGLSQFYSLRYGAVPVVRRTGGLADSVFESEAGNGFVFDDASTPALLAALQRMHESYRDPARWQARQARGMAADFSWARSARAYLALYESLL
jgi:starch synthase